MNESSLNNPPRNVYAEISEMLNQIMLEGAVDSEKNAFDEILSDLKSGKLKPEEALVKAHSIHDKRQNYH